MKLLAVAASDTTGNTMSFIQLHLIFSLPSSPLNFFLSDAARLVAQDYRKCLIYAHQLHPSRVGTLNVGGLAPTSGILGILFLNKFCASVSVYGAGDIRREVIWKPASLRRINHKGGGGIIPHLPLQLSWR